jgi:Kef-type K+ transport system membrane component KefB
MTLLLTQMAIILVITVTCGWIALKVGQARVIGEIIGGIRTFPARFSLSVRLARLKHFLLSGWFCSCS